MNTTMKSYTRTSKRNIYKTPNGTYRARVNIDGMRYSKNFSRLKDATSWLVALTKNA